MQRSIVIGLDGTPYTLLRRFVDEGVMPHAAELVQRGTLLQMDTSIPDISSVAWTSFMTGAGPGRHGIYGFLDLAPASYKIFFPNSKHIKADKLWDVAGRSGRRSVVINVPSTYPAQPLNGVLIAGFVAVDLNKATYPQDLVPKLRDMDYRIDVDARKVQRSHDALMEDILKTLERRIEVLLHLFDKEQWDLFVGVITETDRLQHFFMDAAPEPGHPYHSAFVEFYRRVDGFLGAIAERLRGETLIIMSDHGFTPIVKQVYLNRWLADNGYLKLKDTPKSIEDIEAGSVAFALDPGRIYINVRGKYPLGTVDPGGARSLAGEIKRGLAEISDGGVPVVKAIYERDDLYSGPCIDAAPDLCLQSVYGYDLKGAVHKKDLMDREVFTGMHTQDDSTFYINLPSASLTGARPNIVDVAPTVLSSMGISPPQSMDGHSLLIA
jgi:predicted AlkP superfamily phosphohydrolase/phosphomutase